MTRGAGEIIKLSASSRRKGGRSYAKIYRKVKTDSSRGMNGGGQKGLMWLFSQGRI